MNEHRNAMSAPGSFGRQYKLGAVSKEGTTNMPQNLLHARRQARTRLCFFLGFILSLLLNVRGYAQLPAALLERTPYKTTLSYADWFARASDDRFRDPHDPPTDVSRLAAYYSREEYEALNGQKDISVERWVYSSDGLRIKAVAVSPKTHAHPLPVIVWCRGGLASDGMIRLGDVMIMANWARQGYLVVASQYRGSEGSEGHDEDGGADVHDVSSLLAIARTRPGSDPGNVFLYGVSRGGMMVYETLAVGAQVRAAVVNSGVSDLAFAGKPRPDAAEMEALARAAIPDYDHEKTTGFLSRSAVHWPDKITAPLLILHGTADWRVDPMQALRMAEALQSAGRPYDLIMINGGHHVILNGDQRQLDDLIVNFFAKYVKTGAGN